MNFKIVFYYYQDSLFDVYIVLKLGFSNDIKREEKFINLEAPLTSSILSKILEEGSQIKLLTFSSKHLYSLTYPAIQISFSANTLIIDWSDMNSYYLYILLELWPGLILRLKNLKKYGLFWDLDLIQKFLSFCGRSPPCWKLSFSKVVIDIDIDIDNMDARMDKIILIESYEDVSKLMFLRKYIRGQS